MKRVMVTWWDACSRLTESRWSSLEDIRELSPAKATSVGFLIADEPDYLIVAAHLAEINAGGEVCIPRMCVVSIAELVEANE